MPAVRRILLTCALIALVLPAAAAGERRAPGDGTLVIKDGVGSVQIIARGVVIGRFDQGTVRIKDPNPDDTVEEVVTGAERTRQLNEFWTVYSGKNVRFRFIGGRFTVRVEKSVGIDLSASGKGMVALQGRGSSNDGTYSLNGDSPLPLPVYGMSFPLAAPTTE
jgi:hypothetical protein